MAQTLDKLFDKALSLEPQDRLLLAQLLIGSVQGPPGGRTEEEWTAEVERRIRDVDEGRVETIPWDIVREELRALIEGRPD
jgi:putative addiction module component (TIGR02574 family)